jgi:Arc/MetJ-type ribon-helix-helix transcriptional regulator
MLEMTQTENKEFHKKEKTKNTHNEHAEKIVRKHMTVRIPKGITEAIEDFLNSDQAAKMGFDSKADVVTTAVRRLLTEYGYYEFQSRAEKIKEPITHNKNN